MMAQRCVPRAEAAWAWCLGAMWWQFGGMLVKSYYYGLVPN